MPTLSQKEIWTLDGSITTALVTMLIDKFGTEVLTWSPETVRMEIEDEFRVKPSNNNFNMAMAGLYHLTHDSFYNSLPDFNELCNIFAGEGMTPGVFVPSDAAACAWGITEAMLLNPADNTESPFNDTIVGYVGAVLVEEGIITPPDVLRIAKFDQDLMRKVQYEYTDDPDMFQAIYTVEAAKTEAINSFVKSRLQQLILQLSMLPLEHGKTENVVTKMLQQLDASTELK